MPTFLVPPSKLYYLSEQDLENGHETALPTGATLISDEAAAVIRAQQEVKSPEQVESHFVAAIQQRLDDFARTRNYDSILSACTYATSSVAKFKTEGQACVNLRDATWAAAYGILANVQAGHRPMPTSIADIEADLPVVVWPV